MKEFKIWVSLTVIFLLLSWAGLLGLAGLLSQKITSSSFYKVIVLGAWVLFGTSVIMSIFHYYLSKGKTGLQAITQTGKSMVRINILFYLIGGVIVFVLFLNVMQRIGMSGICELGLNLCFK